jgi:hypothetical protein
MTEPARVNTKVPPLLTIEPVLPLAAHDGDTFRVAVPMEVLIPGVVKGGWSENVRLAHVNAPELSTVQGYAAWQAVEKWLREHSGYRLHVWGREKYGRLLADLEAADGTEEGLLLSTFVAALPGTKPMMLHEQLGVHDG